MAKEGNFLGPRNQAQGLWVWDSREVVGVVVVVVGELELDGACLEVGGQRSEESIRESVFSFYHLSYRN